MYPLQIRVTVSFTFIYFAYSGEYDCQLTTGDGVGGTEVKIDDLTGEECIKGCLEKKKKEDDSINGVTVYSDGRKGCWCEKSMNSIQTEDTTYNTCFLRKNSKNKNRKDLFIFYYINLSWHIVT